MAVHHHGPPHVRGSRFHALAAHVSTIYAHVRRKSTPWRREDGCCRDINLSEVATRARERVPEGGTAPPGEAHPLAPEVVDNLEPLLLKVAQSPRGPGGVRRLAAGAAAAHQHEATHFPSPEVEPHVVVPLRQCHGGVAGEMEDDGGNPPPAAVLVVAGAQTGLRLGARRPLAAAATDHPAVELCFYQGVQARRQHCEGRPRVHNHAAVPPPVYSSQVGRRRHPPPADGHGLETHRIEVGVHRVVDHRSVDERLLHAGGVPAPTED